MEATFKVLNQQRIVLSCALLVGLVLVLLVHAPLIPVILGCLFASGLAIYRSISRSRDIVPTRERK